jgi:hypothetical protein
MARWPSSFSRQRPRPLLRRQPGSRPGHSSLPPREPRFAAASARLCARPILPAARPDISDVLRSCGGSAGNPGADISLSASGPASRVPRSALRSRSPVNTRPEPRPKRVGAVDLPLRIESSSAPISFQTAEDFAAEAEREDRRLRPRPGQLPEPGRIVDSYVATTGYDYQAEFPFGLDVVEAAWSVVKQLVPMRAFYERVPRPARARARARARLSSRSPASSRSCSGACCAAARTTRTSAPR